MSIVPTFSILFMCIGLSLAALSLWSKISSNKLYNECQKLSQSKEFKEMIGKLSEKEKIPILVRADENGTAPWNDLNYPKHLFAMQSFMDEVKLYKKVLNKGAKGRRQSFAYVRAQNFRFKTHQVCCRILCINL
jgi:hypothetical protein